ncbi:MAG: hypothetical protein J0H94_03395 [Rhizobiales bacterium]|nr:hypothetical protein [Hyphomicrobiales bacterium]
MVAMPSESVRLFGTEEKVEPPVVLTAGKLTAELEAGNLRYIRFDGVELLRAVSYIVRDRNWGTYNPVISNLEVEEKPDGFRVTYDAVAKDATQEFRYAAEIEGTSAGRLVFRGRGTAVTDFITNRTGFVVLHPVEGVAGHPAGIEHVDGRIVETSFPDIIDPVQPMMELRAITHEAAPGISVTCRMDGDTFEMEDQRNWLDASYKTYVRPLALPWPYTLAKGTELTQSVTVTVAVTGDELPPAARGARLGINGKEGTIPPLGFGVEPELAAATIAASEALKLAGPHHVIVHADPRRGDLKQTLVAGIEAAIRAGAEPWLELVVLEVEKYAGEVAAAGRLSAELGSPFTTVLVSPAPDMKCTLPGSVWPPAPPLAELYDATRKAFPSARIGGGMFSYFTELNRKRPPVKHLDLVSFTNSGLVHAGDDRSATEGLETLPFIIRSAAAIAGGKPFHAGPSALAMRDNPYGAAPMENPDNIRQAMNRMDPRQRGLLGAGWYLGYFAHMVRGGASAVTLGGGVGPFGIVAAKLDYAQPFFDEAGGVYPAYHVFKGLAELAGARALATAPAPARDIQAVAAEKADGTRVVWLANLTGEGRNVTLDPAVKNGRIFLLDAGSFVEAAKDRDAATNLARPFSGATVKLAPYAIAKITGT